MGDLLYVCPALTACLVGAFDKSAVSRVRLSDIVGLAGCLSDRGWWHAAGALGQFEPCWNGLASYAAFLRFSLYRPCLSCVYRQAMHSLFAYCRVYDFVPRSAYGVDEPFSPDGWQRQGISTICLTPSIKRSRPSAP
jgi:hypothetical protein